MLELSITLPPWQNVVDPFGEIVGTGGAGFTTTDTVEGELAQPLFATTV